MPTTGLLKVTGTPLILLKLSETGEIRRKAEQVRELAQEAQAVPAR